MDALPGSKILFVTSEMTDVLKAGGLGEVSAALPRVLRREGLDVRILIPGYRAALERLDDIAVLAELPALGEVPACRIGGTRMADGLLIYVVLCPELYDRAGSPYGDDTGTEWIDNDVRFARLGLAAADLAEGIGALGWQPDLLHVNDWPSSLAPAYMAWRGQSTPSILTVHNLAYQGVFDRSRSAALGIPDAACRTDGVEFYGKISFLKAGLFYASHLTTVSPTYAKEILTPEMGCGLDGLLRERAGRGQLTGILNGIDDSYDPRSDQHLSHHFDSGDFTGKRSNTMDVRRAFGLADSPGPLFAVVSRLVHQKGVDLVVEAADSIVRQGGQVVAIGQGERKLEEAMSGLAMRYPEEVGVEIGFEEGLARRMYAASDFLLMPSRFEPCGLSQMYAQRFGSLPIARNTGGLADTIEDRVTGFLFDAPSASELRGCIGQAFAAFHAGDSLDRMKTAAMQRPAGWGPAADAYRAQYAETIARAA